MDGGPLAGGDGGDGFYNTAGGGGGGGYFGGGGGASPCWGTGQGGGGGGGSSFLHSDWGLLGHGAASVFCNVGNMWPNGSCQDHGRATITFYGEYTLEGCLDGLACNYNASATQDNGSCLYGCSGCSDSSAANFNPTATVDDGSCVYPLDYCGEGTVWDEDSQTCIIDETYCSWQPDSDGDQLIGVSDLLMFLSVFGDTDLDQDGIFDSNDDCVGEYDECGVCNGNGPSVPIIESIEIQFDSLYAEQIDEWLVYEFADTTFSFVCEIIEGCTNSDALNFDPVANTDNGSCVVYGGCGGLTSIDYHGESYSTVEINDQCWFSENLRTLTFESGDELEYGLSDVEWVDAQASQGAACTIFGQDSVATCNSYSPLFNACEVDAAFILGEYGVLYNWYAVNDPRGLCPAGWRVSTDFDWQYLEASLGIEESELNEFGWRGQDQADSLKESEGGEQIQEARTLLALALNLLALEILWVGLVKLNTHKLEVWLFFGRRPFTLLSQHTTLQSSGRYNTEGD